LFLHRITGIDFAPSFVNNADNDNYSNKRSCPSSGKERLFSLEIFSLFLFLFLPSRRAVAAAGAHTAAHTAGAAHTAACACGSYNA
jgi:hypothetical protein